MVRGHTFATFSTQRPSPTLSQLYLLMQLYSPRSQRSELEAAKIVSAHTDTLCLRLSSAITCPFSAPLITLALIYSASSSVSVPLPSPCVEAEEKTTLPPLLNPSADVSDCVHFS